MVRGKQKRKKLLEEGDVDFGAITAEARKQVWSGAVPVQLQLHPSEITTGTAPSPFLMLAPRNGYLPSLESEIRQHFSRVSSSGSDTIWFDYQGLPMKWHIPTGVLYDLLVAEPERPWNLTVHFKAYPSEVLTLCEDEAVKWNFINALKEASYVMYGSTKSIMNMSQLDQVELWRCVSTGDLEGYDRIAARLRPGFGGGGNWVRDFLHRNHSEDSPPNGAVNRAGGEIGRPGRIPVRVYLRTVDRDLDDLFDATPVTSWDEVAYTTRPMDLREGNILTLRDALMKAVPHLFASSEATHDASSVYRESHRAVTSGPGVDGTSDDRVGGTNEDTSVNASGENKSTGTRMVVEEVTNIGHSNDLDFEGMVRIQGIEPSLDLPLEWVARNLCGPEHFIHLIVISALVAPQLPSRAIN